MFISDIPLSATQEVAILNLMKDGTSQPVYKYACTIIWAQWVNVYVESKAFYGASQTVSQ